MDTAFSNPFTDPGATAVDNIDGTIPFSSFTVDDTSLDTNTSGTNNTITYTVSDSSGNPSSKPRTVNVVDMDAPVITLTGTNPMLIDQYDTYNEPGATADDIVDGTVSVVPDNSSVNTSVVGTYTVSYSATDAAEIQQRQPEMLKCLISRHL